MSLSPKGYLLRKLSRRWFSRHELESLLTEKEVGEDKASEILRELEGAGLVNDLRFAESYIRSRVLTRHKSRWLVRRELKEKGVSDADIEAGFKQFEADEDADTTDIAAADAFISHRKRSLSVLDKQVALRRVYAQLSRRGFSPSVILAACKKHGFL